MFFYARADTHYLLYIYDNMRNELIDRSNPEIPDENKIELVIQKSKDTSLIRFERQVYNEETGRGPGGWYQLLAKTPALFNNEQFAVFRAVHSWRDKISRDDDDSTSFVMPNHIIFSIAKLMPMDMVALLGIAHPISHSVKSRTGELLELIKSAKARGKDGPSMMDVLRPDTVGAIAKANIPSVAAKTLPAPATLVAVINEEELRSDQSSFWGGAFGSSIWDAPAAATPDDGLRLAVPLPGLSSEIFATSNGLIDRSRVQPATESPVPTSQPRTLAKEADEPFTIKQGSNKRKSDVISDDEEKAAGSEADFTSLTNEEQEKAARKSQSKKEKRERKRQKKLAKAQAEAQAPVGAEMEEDQDDEPFDYSKAESVLHGKRNAGDQNGSKQRKKPFDPYAKSADAPKGMRRLQTERPGKSHTFKS
jgi:exosome complex exonuclease RRP6